MYLCTADVVLRQRMKKTIWMKSISSTALMAEVGQKTHVVQEYELQIGKSSSY